MKNILVCLFLLNISVLAQGTAGESAKFEYRTLIDMPSAGVMQKGFVGSMIDILPNGTLIAKTEVGVYDNVSIGISYGGSNIIGTGNPDWYNLPGVNVKYRIIDETLTLPALAVGFDSQGKGSYIDSSSRYEIKSPGFFVAAGKNYAFLGFFSIHGSLNYSLEQKDGENFVNAAFGFEKTIGSVVSLIGEYNFALNDNNTQFGEGNGYLNLGMRWSIGSGFTLEFDLRDLLENKKWNAHSADRSIKIEYIKNIFN